MPRAHYTCGEIGFIRNYILKNGHMNYKDAEQILPEYFDVTGSKRIGAAIYMAAWRFERGYYDHLC